MSRKEIYKSKAWERVRISVWLNQKLLCARCNRPVYVSGLSSYLPKEKRLKSIVHHKEYLTELNYTDDSIAYDINNLEGLCIDCHNKEHFEKNMVTKYEVKFDEFGNLVPR